MEIRSYQIKRSGNDGKRDSIMSDLEKSISAMDDLEKRIWTKAQTVKGGEWQGWWDSLTPEEKVAWATAKSKIGDPRDKHIK